MKLTIMATSDMHGYIAPTNFAERNQDLPFGAAKIYSIMKEIRKNTNGPVVTIENGDFIQGSALSYYIAKSPDHEVSELTQIINLMDYDVGIIGNHEFNYGLSYLKAAIKSYHHPILCANILNQDDTEAFGKPYTIIEKDGVKIAVLGLTTPYIPHWEKVETVKDLQFKSIVETAKKYVPELRGLADVVVVAYHGGFERDLATGEPTERLTGENEGYQLLQEVPGIDAFITGHQHREIAEILNGVPVIQPGYRGANLGVIELELEKTAAGFAVTSSLAEIISAADYPAAPEILSVFETLTPEVETWLDQPLGKVTGDMIIHDPMKARLVEHPYVEFINRVQMSASGADISGTALFNNEGRGFNPLITMRDVITNYIYPNTLAVLKITGADLRQALEQTANYFQLDDDGKIIFNPKFIMPKPQYYNYDMWEGFDYTLDLRNPVGSRVTEFSRNGQTIDPDETLEVVVNQYRAVGGGNYQMFSAEKIVREIQIDMTELIADYLKAHPQIEATVNHNFKILPTEGIE
ncbi:bifunctional metallophosphatase/5'-nucleotidase [Enterococcus timonensis]|uniref:bifunctional metallophosphatase/5'-nucleotidase n=1 Tax=Enterococcus timonensis TaxID=1852364 RepID=UPI0008D994C4|nr:bifunctional metallophosphatase/5'-nucleotidase [Enterococcus timonensis]